MVKPVNYSYYCNKKNKIPYTEWPIECKTYKNWKRDISRHPEWKDLSDEDYFRVKTESKRQRGINASMVMRDHYTKMTDKQKMEVNRKKGSHYKNLSDKEKKIERERLQKISKDFWDNMNDEERKEFGQYRWALKTDEEKATIITRFIQGSINRTKNLSKEEIDNQIKIMNDARIRKLEQDEEFRIRQIDLLRKHNDEYMSNLTREEKGLVLKDNKFNEGFGEMMKLLMTSYSEYILYLFNQMRSIDFPYPEYSHSELIKSYNQLLRLDDNKYLTLSTRNREGDRLIANFHRSIYHAHKKGKPSPYEAWYNDDLLMKCIKNRTIYRSVLDKNKILQGFNVSKIAPKVSVFSAGRAKLIINKYLKEFDTIFDPFSGFSGRMLGAISLGKKYIGRDMSYVHIKESIMLADFLSMCKSHFNILYPDIKVANVMSINGEYECLFTCPPYGMKEIWQGGICDSRSCDDWIDICLCNFKCKRYLFVVDETEKYQNNIVDVILNRSHFGKNNEYIILLDRGD